ncbi:MAG: DUF4349 domain-containing protein [Bacteroidia bacterium]|nr:DUF4349 domain-containing protein [Bacteroidia bacterium]
MRTLRNVLVAPLLLVACSKTGSGDGGNPSASYAEEAAPPPSGEAAAAKTAADGTPTQLASQSQAPARARLVIYTGQLSLQVANVDSAAAAARRFVEAQGGYVGKQELNNSGTYRQEHRLVLRVPQQRFDATVAELEGLASYVESKQLDANDITEEFVDNEARLTALRATEAQYLEVLKQARSVEDILKVRDYLGRIREDIERYAGRQRYLSDQVALATLTVTFYKLRDLPTEPGFTFWDKVGRGISNGWEGLLSLLVIVVTIWPLLVVLGGVWAFVTYRRRKTPKV